MKRALACVITILFLQAAVPPAGDPAGPCDGTLTPPFVTNAAKPNILIILDNSNSMDEDFYGNAVGSWSPTSKSVMAKKALQTMVTDLQGKANVGIMTFKLPTDLKSYKLHNALPFASYDPKSYCANPPAACTTYCISEDATAKSDCEAQCPGLTTTDFSAGGSAKFPDKLISDYSTNDPIRERYCRLIYPKTKRMQNPTDTGNYIYWKQADPFYDTTNDGTLFGYSGSEINPSDSKFVYSSAEYADNWYRYCTVKTGTNNDYTTTSYSGTCSDWHFGPTDSDYALGFYNFGQRMPWYYVGATWFSNTAVSGGNLRVPNLDLSDSTNLTKVMGMLNPTENDSDSYMGTKFCFDSSGISNSHVCSSTTDCTSPYNDTCSTVSNCTTSNRNDCPFIVNAGLTPTAGVLDAAYKYFNGTYSGKFCMNSSGVTNGKVCSAKGDCPAPYNSSCSDAKSPITLKCQRNFIIFVTDGLPSTKLDGTKSLTITDVLPEVITKLTALKTGVTKTLSGTSYTFPIRTYVLGVGLSDQAKTNLDQMAVAGGTQTPSGHAYYADDPTQLLNALSSITTDLLARVASGSSISILSEGQTHMGANMLQGVFYPKKDFGTSSIYWPGYLYNYWFYNLKTLNNIREDTVHDFILDLDEDNGLIFSFDDQAGLSVNRYSDPAGSGDPNTFVDKVDLDSVQPIWEAGKQLFKTAWNNRRIFISDSSGSGDFNTSNTTLTSSSSLLGSTANLDACLATDPANPTLTSLQNLIKYVKGYDLPNCRKRAMGLCTNAAGTDYSSRACNSDTDCTVSGYGVCRQGIWKLGDIVYATPKVQTDYMYCTDGTAFDTTKPCTENSQCSTNNCQKMENVVFVGANDGMLHAFRTGIETNSGLDATSHQIEKLKGVPDPVTGIPDYSGIGTEIWGFIPKNSLPYLRCLAVPPPGVCHLYYSDLSPYITKMNTKDGKARKVLIGGMRLGGASVTTPGKYCFDNSTPPATNWQSCASTATCASPYNTTCSIPSYCFDSTTGQSSGQTCSSAANCTSPYDTCLSATDTNVYSFNAPKDTCAPVKCTDPNTCYNPTGCTGLSSYYALDITDVESPKVLWEFSHPLLGYSYSGPAVIHKWLDTTSKTGDQYYVMFGSGPTDAATGTSMQNVRAFVLKLKAADLATGDYLKIESVYSTDFGNSNQNGFTGRLFTTGVDVNTDTYTDFVLMGFGYSPSGNVGDFKGGIAKINTTNIAAKPTTTNPTGADPLSLALDPASWTWDVGTYSNIAQLPITAKVETMQCFTRLYLYTGTGRYFFPLDDYGPAGSAGKNFLTGAPFTCDQWNVDCAPNINAVNPNNNACADLTGSSPEPAKAFWQLVLNDAEGSYLKERMTTDPSISDSNKIYFTTAQPTGDSCGYGGRSRVWGVNCATGAALLDTSCTGYTITNMTGTLYLQTSTGAIYKIDPGSSFSNASSGFRTTGWMVGMPPENAPPVVTPSAPARTGTVIQWIEK